MKRLFIYMSLFALLFTTINNCISQKSQYIFNQITIENGLSNNSITCIFKDSRGFIWFGTNSGLVKYYKDSGNIKIFKNQKNNLKSISNNIITSISEDHSRNELWVGTEDGLNIFDKETEEFNRYFSKKGNTNTK